MFAQSETDGKESVTVTMGRRIASRRTLLGMDGGELGEKVGVTREWISAIENDRAGRISHTTLMQLAKVLGVTETWILHGDKASAA